MVMQAAKCHITVSIVVLAAATLRLARLAVGELEHEPHRLSGGHQDAERVSGGIGKHVQRLGLIV
jgi:hypothetical protein